MSLDVDPKSKLGQKTLTLKLSNVSFFTRVLFQLMKKSFVYKVNGKFKNIAFISPDDKNLLASDYYRGVIRSKFDLVAVDNQSPLEPNIILIEMIPDKVDLDFIKRINLE